jgi:hypothetical protein
MKIQNHLHLLVAGPAVLALVALLLPGLAKASVISEEAAVGPYTVTLKVLPAESFSGAKAEMVREGGAQPNTLTGPTHPNHHMVVFVTKSGKQVEDAKVAISYRRLSPEMGEWMTLPVVRMHMAGRGFETTHYGNNVSLAPGSYEIRVTVNGKGPAKFRFSLPS